MFRVQLIVVAPVNFTAAFLTNTTVTTVQMCFSLLLLP